MAPQHSISQFKPVASAPQPTAAGAEAKSERRFSSEDIRIKNSLEAPGRAHLAQRFNAALSSKSTLLFFLISDVANGRENRFLTLTNLL